MPGTLIPPWYVPDLPSCDDLTVVSVAWGFSLGLTVFGLIRASDQTLHQWKRTRRITAYMVFIWLELVASTVIGGIGWGHVYGTIPPSFEFFFFIIIMWMFQIHCIMQIIINRIALLAVSPTTVCRLRWGIFSILLVINISVGCVWIPARLQINPTWIHVNNIYDRLEKAIFAAIDVCLNLYFIYLVRSSLIEYGLTKYVLLYRFNQAMIILIIATMSLSNTFIYVIFHPLAYLVKLHIELSMAELIGKIVKATGPDLTCVCICHQNSIHTFAFPPGLYSSAPVEAGPVASIRGRMRYTWPRWPAPLRAIRHGEGGGDGAQSPIAGRDGIGLRMIIPRTEESGGRTHSCPTLPTRKDSGFATTSIGNSAGQSSSSSKSTTDHLD